MAKKMDPKATMIEQRAARKLRSGVMTAREMLAGLEHGGRLIGLTGGHFSLLDLIEAVLHKTGPADVVIATWTAGVRDTEMARELGRFGLARSMRLVVDQSFPGRQPKYVAAVLETFGPEAIRMTRIHAKFAMIRNDEWSILIRTSMNLNRNHRVELFELDDDADLCDWWAGEIVEPLWADLPAGFDVPGRRLQAHWQQQWKTDVNQADDVKTTSYDAGSSQSFIDLVLRSG